MGQAQTKHLYVNTRNDLGYRYDDHSGSVNAVLHALAHCRGLEPVIHADNARRLRLISFFDAAIAFLSANQNNSKE